MVSLDLCPLVYVVRVTAGRKPVIINSGGVMDAI